MRRTFYGLAVLLCALAPATVEAVAAYKCPAGGPGAGGPPTCTCVSWNASFEIRCPGITNWRELSTPPNPRPNRNPGGGGSGAPGGNPPGGNLMDDQELLNSFNNALSIALERGRLSAMLPKSHPDYEPTDCMELFAPYGPSMSNGKWLINQFIIFRTGEGVQSNGEAPCSVQGKRAWTLNAGSAYPYVFICKQLQYLPPSVAASTLIHEALHVAGLKESPQYPGKPTSAQIQAKVKQECNL